MNFNNVVFNSVYQSITVLTCNQYFLKYPGAFYILFYCTKSSNPVFIAHQFRRAAF